MAGIKYIDFVKTAKIQKDFEGATGLYDEDQDIIFIHAHAPETTQWSKAFTLAHEKAHRMVCKKKVREYFTEDQNEAFADIWAMINMKKGRLYGLEKMVFDRHIGHMWREKEHRRVTLERILVFIGMETDKIQKVIKGLM